MFAEIGRGKDSKNIFSDKGIDDVYIPETFLDLNSKQQLGVRTCSAGRNQLFVRYNGEVYPCPSYMKREYCYSNLKKSLECIRHQYLYRKIYFWNLFLFQFQQTHV